MSKRVTCEQFIEKAKETHGDKYDYSKVEYVNNRTKVCIICPEHGEFWQIPTDHLNGKGCSICARIQMWDTRGRKTTEQFVEQARAIHGDKYDYSKVEYIGSKTKVCIICPEHGEFWQTPNDHLAKKGCSICGGRKQKTTTEFINDAKAVHSDRYIYDKAIYKNSSNKVCVICPKHGEFWISPSHHIQSKQGCPKCSESKLEMIINDWLTANQIKFEYEKRFDWLGLQSLDFYLPDYNTAIECQGIQHFKSVKYFGGAKMLYDIQERDKRKLILCQQNNIEILYYSNLRIEYPYQVYENLDELLIKLRG